MDLKKAVTREEVCGSEVPQMISQILRCTASMQDGQEVDYVY